MTQMNQYFRQKIRENSSAIIMIGGVSIVLFSMVACVLNAQRTRKQPVDPIPKIIEAEEEPLKQPHEQHGSLSVHEFEYDGTSYLLVEKNSEIAVTKK
jgi:hypothetical protein